MNCEVVNGGKVTKLKVNLNVNKIIHIVTLNFQLFNIRGSASLVSIKSLESVSRNSALKTLKDFREFPLA